MLNSTLDGKQNIEKLHENQVLNRIKLSLKKKKQDLQGNANSRVWLQYMEMIDILRSNIRSERTGLSIFLIEYLLIFMLVYMTCPVTFEFSNQYISESTRHFLGQFLFSYIRSANRSLLHMHKFRT